MLSNAWTTIMGGVDTCLPDIGARWALERSRIGPVRVLTREFGVLSPYDELPAGVDVDRVSRALGSLDADVLMLRAIPEGDALLRVPAIRRVAYRTERSWSIDLTAYADADAWVASRSKGRRRSLRKGRKALGEVRFGVADSARERADLVEHAIRLKRAWLDERGTFSRTFSSPSFRKDLVERWSQGGHDTPVLSLTADGQVAAVELGLRRGDAYRAYMGAFDPRFDGAGVVMTYEAVAWSYAQGCSSYDLLAPETQFKRSWMDIQTPIYSAIVPLTSAGRLARPALMNGPDLARKAVRFGEQLARRVSA